MRLTAIRIVLTASLLAGLIWAQGTAADYTRAQGLRGRFQGLVVDVAGNPYWINNTDHFWYRKSVKGGYEYVTVYPESQTKKPAFDHEKLAAALSVASGRHYTAVTLPFTEPPAPDTYPGHRISGRGGAGGPSGALTFVTEQEITFAADQAMWDCKLDTYSCSETGAAPAGFAGGRGARGGGPYVDEDANSPADPLVDPDDPMTAPPMADPDVEDGIALLAPQGGFQASPQAQAAARGGRGANGAAAEMEVTSPDGKTDALIQNFNVFLRPHGDARAPASPLSYDGSEGNYYTLRSIAWSPDSTRIAASKTQPGYQRELWYVESSPADQLQPKHSTMIYDKPGDTLPIARPALFDVKTRHEIEVDNKLFPNAYSLSQPVWWKDGRGFTFEYNQRGHQAYRVIEVNGTTGEARTLIDELSKTFIDYRPLAEGRTDTGKEFRYNVDDGKEIIWASERDRWEHLYLYDGVTGRVKNQITKGNWVVRYVDWVDEANRQVWFRASGMNAGQDPYFLNYYRINFDGTGLTAFTSANGEHSTHFSPDGKYFVDSYQRVDMAPVMELHTTANPSAVTPLEAGDISALKAAGWQTPEVFVAKGRDGTTDIWGVIFKPTNFDPSKKYPVVENIYAGPQGSFVPKTFNGTAQALPELGFIVVQIDGMGTNNRSRAFHDTAFQNLADAGFLDRILWHKAVAAKYPWYDITRVGIYGTSAGGQNALGGLLFHPEFYKAGVANSGCHDNRMDKMWWNEQWMGWPLGPQYAAASNVDNAYRLQGKLMLVLGEMDNNVDPSSTMQVVAQLEKHNKTFDFIYVPGAGHGGGGGAAPNGYLQTALNDFFVKNLLDIEPPVRNRAESAASN